MLLHEKSPTNPSMEPRATSPRTEPVSPNPYPVGGTHHFREWLGSKFGAQMVHHYELYELCRFATENPHAIELPPFASI